MLDGFSWAPIGSIGGDIHTVPADPAAPEEEQPSEEYHGPHPDRPGGKQRCPVSQEWKITLK